mgnify:CR=1 FL=1
MTTDGKEIGKNYKLNTDANNSNVTTLVNKAKSAVIYGRIIRLYLADSYFYIYIFVGKYRDYILYNNYCSCKYFIFNNIFRQHKIKCYHQLALEIALQQDKIRNIVVDKNTLEDIIMEIYSMDKSFILRKLIFSEV